LKKTAPGTLEDKYKNIRWKQENHKAALTS
jgi:hypothetical protein